jgi:hypothetical protein
MISDDLPDIDKIEMQLLQNGTLKVYTTDATDASTYNWLMSDGLRILIPKQSEPEPEPEPEISASSITYAQLYTNTSSSPAISLPIANIDNSSAFTNIIKIEPWNIIFSGSGTGPDWTTETLSSMHFTWQDTSSNPDNDIGYVLEGKKYDGNPGSGIKGQIIVSGGATAATYNVVSYNGFNSSTMTWDVEINETPLPSGNGTGGTNQFYIDFKVDSANLN